MKIDQNSMASKDIYIKELENLRSFDRKELTSKDKRIKELEALYSTYFKKYYNLKFNILKFIYQKKLRKRNEEIVRLMKELEKTYKLLDTESNTDHYKMQTNSEFIDFGRGDEIS